MALESHVIVATEVEDMKSMAVVEAEVERAADHAEAMIAGSCEAVRIEVVSAEVMSSEDPPKRDRDARTGVRMTVLYLNM